jgi:hypothetical protein
MVKPSEKRRQKARQHKAAKRKERKEKGRASLSRFQLARFLLRESGSWPLYECLLSKEWQKEGAITQILVTRRSPSGQIAAGMFLVDLGCLGVKNAFARLFDTRREYRQLRNSMTSSQDMIKADLNLVAKIVREAIAYARDLGFKPNPDYRDAMLALGEADPDACGVSIPLGGPEGKPLFIAGPYDNVDQIMTKLTRKLGPEGFHYLIAVDGDQEVFLLDE